MSKRKAHKRTIPDMVMQNAASHAIEIINTVWKTPAQTNIIIGIVARDVSLPDEKMWQAYIGYGYGLDEKEDTIQVAKWGAKLSPKEAIGFFPHLNIDEYKPQ